MARTELWVGGIALDYLLKPAPRTVPAWEWIWIHSGKSFNNTVVWNPGEPNRFLEPLQYEACVMVRPYYGRHGLNDAHCSAVRPCLCEASLP